MAYSQTRPSILNFLHRQHHHCEQHNAPQITHFNTHWHCQSRHISAARCSTYPFSFKSRHLLQRTFKSSPPNSQWHQPHHASLTKTTYRDLSSRSSLQIPFRALPTNRTNPIVPGVVPWLNILDSFNRGFWHLGDASPGAGDIIPSI